MNKQNNIRENDEICPFFVRDRGLSRASKKYCMSCEGCALKFPDKQSKRLFVYKLCAHPDGYKDCTMYKVLYDYYDRLYSKERKE